MLSSVQNICKMTVHICSTCVLVHEYIYSQWNDSICTSQCFHNRIEAKIFISQKSMYRFINFPTCIQWGRETVYLVHRALFFTLNLGSVIIPLLLSWLLMSRRCQHTTQNNPRIISQTHASMYKMVEQPFQIKSFKFLFILQHSIHV